MPTCECLPPPEPFGRTFITDWRWWRSLLLHLRERADDIVPLARMFLERFSKLYGRPVRAIAQPALERLLEHEWPGNIRELENVIRNGVLQCEGLILHLDDLTSLRELKNEANSMAARPAPLQEVVDHHVLHVLRSCDGNKARAAALLEVSRSTLYRMLERDLHPRID